MRLLAAIEAAAGREAALRARSIARAVRLFFFFDGAFETFMLLKRSKGENACNEGHSLSLSLTALGVSVTKKRK